MLYSAESIIGKEINKLSGTNANIEESCRTNANIEESCRTNANIEEGCRTNANIEEGCRTNANIEEKLSDKCQHRGKVVGQMLTYKIRTNAYIRSRTNAGAPF